jgi:hypothetical protein
MAPKTLRGGAKSPFHRPRTASTPPILNLAISDPGYTRWAILAGLSVPFVLVSAYIMFFGKPAHLDNLEFE